MGFPGPGAGFGGGTPSAGSTTSSTPSFKKAQSTAPEASKSSSNFPKIESLKAKGNDFFKAGDLDQAGATYFEVTSDELRSG